MLIQRARDTMCVVAFCALVGGQDELVFDGHSLVVDHRGEIVARAAQFSEELLVATVDPLAPLTYRLRDARRRVAKANARPVPTIASLDLAAARRARRAAAATGGPVAPALEGAAEVYAALVARPARLRRQERLQTGRARPLRRRRLGAGRGGRRRRARPRRRRRRGDAVAVLLAGDARPTRASSPTTSGSSGSSSTSSRR